jgi:hypothetical protein
VQLDGVSVGTLNAEYASFPCTVHDLAMPKVRIVAADEGAWYLPDRVWLTAQTADHTTARAAWEPGDPIGTGATLRELVLPLHWRTGDATSTSAVWKGCDRSRGGAWPGTFGAVAAWVAGTPSASATLQNGFRLTVDQGRDYTWDASGDDTRAPVVPGPGLARRTAACWFDAQQVDCGVVPGDDRPYRLTLYLLDFDRAGRSVTVSLVDDFGQPLDTRPGPAEPMSKGVYLSWTVARAARVQVRYTGANVNANAVVSAVFVDR